MVISQGQGELLDLAAPDERAGFRLQRLELLNWGTFDGSVWHLHAGGDTSLLTGDIGSGKSTIVDALTTLLVAPQRAAYNKAAGAETRERTARSYFFGHYKAERSENGGGKPVALRDQNSHSVLLAQFFNEGYQQPVTVAQVLWMREQEGQPARLFVVADQHLSIAEHFSGFRDVAELRRRLGPVTKEVHDSFPPYQTAFRRRFGIESDQALDLFHQTVSMKSVGNLTDFVREHMLQPFPVEERIERLIGHVDDLTRAHEAVVKAKDQLRLLTPLVEQCDEHDRLAAEVQEARTCREALRPWMASLTLELLTTAIERCLERQGQLDVDLEQIEARRRDFVRRRDAVKQDIARNGGERIERVRAEQAALREEQGKRERRARAYESHAAAAGLAMPSDAQEFLANLRRTEARQAQAEVRVAAFRQRAIDAGVRLQAARAEGEGCAAEVESLRSRRSSIPAEHLQLRRRLCDATGIDEGELPFAGELLQVHADEQAWEGAIERVLRGFGTSLLVPDARYAEVSAWVDRTHLGARLVYHRVKEARSGRSSSTGPDSLVRKLEFKHGAPLVAWVEDEVAHRFDLACCDRLEDFRREKFALTRSGQVKGGHQHTKDDRTRVDDRTRYVLGWRNEEKLAAMERAREMAERRAQAEAIECATTAEEEKRLGKELDALKALALHSAFDDLDWRSCAAGLSRLDAELESLERGSDLLASLQRQIEELEAGLADCERKQHRTQLEVGKVGEQRSELERRREVDRAIVVSASPDARTCFAALEALRVEAGDVEPLTIGRAPEAERSLREWLQRRIDADDQRKWRLAQRIVSAMQEYRNAYPGETREAAASVEAAGEYRRMRDVRRSDDLPRFERRFKELLNENTIREVANFQSRLLRERHEIEERIATINRSLRAIEFNTGRYIRLETASAADAEIRDFQHDLRACTEGTLIGSGDEAYSEAKFLQVKKIIDRFRGREGSTDLDQKWTRKVTDVRNWFGFAASERWQEIDEEYEHYTDSGGKSGGQKEKLAYTVLAASLAYQFGLEWGETRSRSFRFVVIDEAFGRGSDESATYGLKLFGKLNLQLLVVTPLQKIHVIEPFVANVGFVSNTDGQQSKLRNITIEQYRAEKARRSA
jgi:uncharacterized protein YPO0396